MTTKRKMSRSTEREGVNFVRSLVERNNCTFQENDQSNDLGNDAYIEFVDNEDATGCCIAVQIKSGISYLAKSGTSYAFSTNRDHFEYWASHILPVAAIIHDPTSQTAVWTDITQHLNDTPGLVPSGPYTISIPLTATFADATFGGFREHFLTYRAAYRAQDALHFDRALERFVDLKNMRSCMDGMRALFSYHRNRAASWYFLIASFRRFRGHPLLSQLIALLCHIPGHGDILWHRENIIDERTRGLVVHFMRASFTSEDVRTLVEAVDDNGFQRGTIGQCVDALIGALPDREALLESVAFDASLNEPARYYALFLLFSYLPDNSTTRCLDLRDRYLGLFPDTEFVENLEWAVNEIKTHGELQMY